MKNHSKFLRRGFTLLELLIVIAIIGILISVAAASYSSAQIKSRNARRMQDMKSVQSAMEQYYATNAQYPATASPSCDPGTTYLPAGLPTDPKPSMSYVVSCTTGGGVSTYYGRATMEGSVGNSSSATCATFTTNGTYFCVKNLQ